MSSYVDAGSVGRAARQGLQLEPLERRLLLSGNVTVVVVGGSLVVTGDGESNGIGVTQYGCGPNEFYVWSLDGTTTTNGGIGAYAPGVTKDVKLKMGDGDDTVELVQFDIPGKVTFDGGEGDNHLGIGSWSATGSEGPVAKPAGGGDIGGDVIVKNGGGYDELWVDDTDIYGNVKVSNGDGGCDVLFEDTQIYGDVQVKNGSGGNAFTADAVFFHGSLSIQNGDGYNVTRTTAETTIAGDASVKGGDGFNRVAFNPVAIGGNVSVTNGLGECITRIDNTSGGGIVGNVTVKNAGGDQYFGVFDADIGGNVSVKHGDGYSETEFVDTAVGGDLAITGGNTGNHDDVYFYNTGVNGKTAVKLGDGDDNIEFWISGFNGASLFDGGRGNDWFVDHGQNGFRGGPRIVNFEHIVTP